MVHLLPTSLNDPNLATWCPTTPLDRLEMIATLFSQHVLRASTGRTGFLYLDHPILALRT